MWPWRRKVYAFDFWVTLTDRPKIRALARKYFKRGHEVHIVSAISPGLPLDNDESYAQMMHVMKVPYTEIHRTDHVAAQKVEVLLKIKADCFWDDTPAYVEAARAAGIKAILA
jgi:hypothetical protein